MTILVVEDDRAAATALQELLKDLGFTSPAVASSGEEALERLGEDRPDLVLMDVRLSGQMDGVETAERLRLQHDIPVVFLSAYSDDETIQRAKLTEPFGYLVKPIHRRDLHIAVEMALYKHRMEKQVQASERWLSTILRSIGDALIATDQEARIRFMNPVAERLTGWKQERALGKDLEEVVRLVDEGTREAVECRAKVALRDGSALGLANHTLLVSEDGTEVSVDEFSAPIQDDGGHVLGAVVVIRDVTERERDQVELLRNARQLTALSRIGQTLAASLDTGEVLKKVIESVSTLVQAEGVSLLLKEKGDQLVFAAVIGAAEEALQGERMPATAGVAGEVIRTGRSVIVNDPSSQAKIYREIEEVTDFHTQSLLAVPLRLGDEVFGVIEAVHADLNVFDKGDLKVLEETAKWATIAIDNARQHESLQRRLRESQAMAEISQALSETLDLGRILQLIVDSVRRIIPSVNSAVIHLLDKDAQTLKAAAVSGEVEPFHSTLSMKVGNGIAGMVALLEDVINVNDKRLDPRVLEGGHDSMRSLMVAPVQSGPLALGTISVQSAEPHAFSQDDERLLATLGRQAALAIENARLFEVERRRAEEAEALGRITQTLITRLTLSDMLETVVGDLAQVTDYERIRLFLLEKDQLLLQAQVGCPEGIETTLRLDQGVSGQVARSRSLVLLDRENLEKDPLESVPGTMSMAGVPISHAGRVLGVLVVESTVERAFDFHDMTWLENVGRQLGVAVENARLYADLERALENDRAARAQLVRTEKLAAMGRMTASIAHELNNPLQAIQNALFLVKHGSDLPPQSLEDLEVACSEADRMAKLISRLRETYRPATSELLRPLSLNRLVEEVHQLIQTHLRHNQVAWEFEADPDLPTVLSVPDQIKQLLLNLSLNAVEAMPNGGRLRIGTKHIHGVDEVLVTVEDTGVGIAPELLPTIFDPFVTYKKGGTGLGLAISADIVQRHRGRIEVESECGVGTTFSVWLPVDYLQVGSAD